MRVAALAVVLSLAAGAQGEAVSPVQKVVELLEECKAKVEKDLAAEGKAMAEYMTFCDDELTEKGYAIETAGRSIQDVTATIEDGKATVAQLEDEIAALGGELAGKDRELAAATTARESAHASFVSSEKEMLESVDELGRAVAQLKSGSAAFLQGKGKRAAKLRNAVKALSVIVEANGMGVMSKEKLSSFMQTAKKVSDDLYTDLDSNGEKKADADDDDLDLDSAVEAKKALALSQEDARGAPKPKAFESATGGIIETVEEMQEKAEDTLSELRKKEMEEQQSYELVANGLNNEITHATDKKSQATSNKASTEQKLSEASAKLVDTTKSKAADEDYSASLKTECETKATEWEERQKSAKEEMGAIEKAKEILTSGVKEFVQISQNLRRVKWGDDEENGTVEDAARSQLVNTLRGLARKRHSFALSQLAARAKSDPFGKIRGLIEDMIAKLLEEANEEATHEAFCQEEMGKSKTSKDDKEGKLEKFKNRIDEAEATISQLTQENTDLAAEIAEIDKAQAEATEIRNTDNAEYKQASSDYKQSAEAVAKAIEVLKSYYEGASLVQVSVARSTQRQPEFGGAKSDTGHTIISVLEMSMEDFTSLLAEAESTETDAVKEYTKLTNENKISRASKETEIKAKESEMKSLKVALENAKEDHASVKQELDAVLSYLDKLKPECESKAMSYEEKKAAREAEISGLKDALEILQGKGLSLAQTGRQLRKRRNL